MHERYARQMALSEVGLEGQSRINAARVLVVGAGGLGCAVLQYLCAAGVGHLTIVDHDRVEEANLHRQPLYRMTDLGRSKTDAARDALRALNPQIDVEVACERLTPANASAFVKASDIVVDAADLFAVTYTLSDECSRTGKPLVSASVLGMSGYAGAFCGTLATESDRAQHVPSYRAVFPDIPARAGTCATAGVLGTAVGVMGTLQAHLVLSLILSLRPSVGGRIVTFDFATLRIGGFSFASATEPPNTEPRFIAETEVIHGDLTVDLRSAEEAARRPFNADLRVPVEDVAQVVAEKPRAQRIVLCCRSGVRAWRAATQLRTHGHNNVALIAIGD
jgi:molybdopterin/thiamine biosynthesis adenylyltransferase/rhodanese-related sulfurtransferase